jgi:AcrR family transcriptional regulator
VNDDKRECILTAAVRAFSRLGFRKTSIDEVAQAAGVGKGTIYLAVSSKDELYLSAVEREVKGFLASGRKLLGLFD